MAQLKMFQLDEHGFGIQQLQSANENLIENTCIEFVLWTNIIYRIQVNCATKNRDCWEYLSH